MRRKYKKIIPVGATAGALLAIVSIVSAINNSAIFHQDKKQAIEKEQMRELSPMDTVFSASPVAAIPASTIKDAQEAYISECPVLVRRTTEEAFPITNSLDIGRAEYNDIIIASDPHVSRSHCKIFSRNGHYFITDMNAKTKATLNGQPIDNFGSNAMAYRLNDGDLITICSEVFEFHLPEITTVDSSTLSSSVTLV